jgi:hypothetical protein
MINREELGVVEANWPVVSIPVPVEDYLRKLIGRLPPEVSARQVGKGYHVAGWAYLEIEIHAPSWGRAYEEAERICQECAFEFHWRNVQKGKENK